MGNTENKKMRAEYSLFRAGLLDIEQRQLIMSTREEITGAINLTMAEVLPGSQLMLQLIGVEKTLIMSTNKLANTSKNDRRAASQRTEFLRLTKNFPAQSLDGFRVGSYSFDYNFRVDSNVPPSFNHTCTLKDNTFSVKIEYYLEALLFTNVSKKALRRRLKLTMISRERLQPGSRQAVLEYKFPGLPSLLGSKTIKMQMRTIDDFIDVLSDNPVYIEIDATNSHSSPLNLTLQLCKTVDVRSYEKNANCRSVIWEQLIASKLQKGIKYENDTSLFTMIPAHATQQMYETVETANVQNRYYLRLFFERKNPGFLCSEQQRFVELILPTHLIRRHRAIPVQRLQRCPSPKTKESFIPDDPIPNLDTRIQRFATNQEQPVKLYQVPIARPASNRKASYNKQDGMKFAVKAQNHSMSPRHKAKNNIPALANNLVSPNYPQGQRNNQFNFIPVEPLPVKVSPPGDIYPSISQMTVGSAFKPSANYPPMDSTNARYFHNKKNEFDAFGRLNRDNV